VTVSGGCGLGYRFCRYRPRHAAEPDREDFEPFQSNLKAHRLVAIVYQIVQAHEGKVWRDRTGKAQLCAAFETHGMHTDQTPPTANAAALAATEREAWVTSSSATTTVDLRTARHCAAPRWQK